jgi:hypothetical protein
MRRTSMRRVLAVLAAAIVLSLPVTASAQAVRQFGRTTCEASTSGGVPTGVTVSREVTNTNVWTVLTPTPLPLSGTPLRAAPFTDLIRVSGVSYRYRCDFINAAGTVSSLPVPPGGQVFLDITLPGQGTANFEIITQ